MDELFDAIEAGDVARVSAILASEPGLANAVDRRTSAPPAMSMENAKLIGEDSADVAKPSRPPWTALHTAVIRRRVDVARVLIDHGANLYARDHLGRSPLHNALLPYAAVSLDLLELLLSSGADANARDDRGEPPLDHAIFMHDAAAVDVLIRFGADVNVRPSQVDAWMLYRTMHHGEIEIARLLIDAGADVNARSYGRTALHVAAQRGHDKIVEMLLAAGANPRERDDKNKTPLDLTKEHLKMLAILERHAGRSAG